MLEEVHAEPLLNYTNQPQWRIFVAPVTFEPPAGTSTFYLAFASSHALMDGASGLLFHKTFLQELENIGSCELDASPIFNTAPEPRVAPALEHAGSLSISWSFLLGPLLSEYLPPLATALGLGPKAVNNTWLGASARPAKPASSALLPTAVRVLHVPQTTLQRVLAMCRKHNARLTALLNHCVACALAMALQVQGHSFENFKVVTAMDLRRLIPESQDSMANYVSALTEDLTVDQQLSRDARPQVNRSAVQNSTLRLAKAASTLSDQPVGLLKYLSNFRGWTLKNASKPADASFSMSNLGVFSRADESRNWNISQMSFSQSADGTGAPFNINVASVKDGPLAITITWWPGMLGVDDEGDFIEYVCERILQQLEALD